MLGGERRNVATTLRSWSGWPTCAGPWRLSEVADLQRQLAAEAEIERYLAEAKARIDEFAAQRLSSITTLTDHLIENANQLQERFETAETVRRQVYGLIAAIGDQRRIPVRYEQLPKKLVQAFLATEDDRFFQHHGVDWQGILRAAVANFKAGRISQGANLGFEHPGFPFAALLAGRPNIERKLATSCGTIFDSPTIAIVCPVPLMFEFHSGSTL